MIANYAPVAGEKKSERVTVAANCMSANLLIL